MAVNISLTTLTSLQNEATALAGLASNNTATVTAFQDCLALDGTSPNQMQASLDMNGHSIINCPSVIAPVVGGYTVATLPSTPTEGMLVYVTDGTSSLAWGATVTGGHSTQYLVWYNGTNWTVMGK